MNFIRRIYFGLVTRLLILFWKINNNSLINGRIIMFHEVLEKCAKEDSCKCDIDKFRKVILKYKDIGYHFISIDEAVNVIESRSNKNFIVLTFDDVFESIYTNVFPILKELQIPFTIYITIELINSPMYLNTSQLKEFANCSLCTIGSHTISHPKLRYSVDSSREILESRKILAQLTGKEINHFAYPYGSLYTISKKNIQQVEKAGYKTACTTISFPLTDLSTKNLFKLPRIVGNYSI